MHNGGRKEQTHLVRVLRRRVTDLCRGDRKLVLEADDGRHCALLAEREYLAVEGGVHSAGQRIAEFRGFRKALRRMGFNDTR